VASPGAASQAPPGNGGIVDDTAKPLDKDNRTGHVAPTARQRSLGAAAHARARFNDLGTPSMLTASGGALASGLPADPAAAARAYINANRELLGLTPRAAQALDVVTVAPLGAGAAVVMQQRFGNLVAGHDGILVVGVRDGSVLSVSGSLARDAAQPAPAQLTANEARRIAVRDASVAASAVQSVDLVAVPTPSGARAAYNVLLIDGNRAEPVGLSTFVDARDGSILVREDLVDHATDDPEWEVFQVSPPVDYSSSDTRARWCFTPLAGCDEVVGTSASPRAWDIPTSNQKQSSQTTNGNNSFAVHNWFSNDPFSVGTELATLRPNRDYSYPWTNQWFEQKCAPTTFDSPQRNDIDAARANLFAMHNRMHDWSYHLGFTEATWNMQDNNFGRAPKQDDPEQGNAQAGGVSGGPPDFAARDNANQITPRDGRAPTTNMYLWQSIAGAFYAPVRRRRLRHDGHRSRVHPRHHQPHDRRPQRRPLVAAGHERELVGPDGDGVPQRARVRPRRRAGVHHRPVRDVGPRGRHPQLQHERQPAELQQRRLRLRRPPGARLRRGVERDQLRHPVGHGRQVRRRDARTPEVVRQRGDAGHLVPRQPPLGATGVRLVPPDGPEPGEPGGRP
jgi:hypothetical protein